MNNPACQAAVLDDGTQTWSTIELEKAVSAFDAVLRVQGVRVLATLLDNSVAWVIADLAAVRAEIVHVPLPAFFSAQQIAHALSVTGADALLTHESIAAQWPQVPTACSLGEQTCALLRLPGEKVHLPAGTSKITFTSGTTGNPKGVCLRLSAMDSVANGLVSAIAPLQIKRHLCALPLAVLLENIAGLLTPLRNGTTCVVAPLAQLGLTGSSGFDPATFHAAVLRLAPDSLILLPQMLRMWLNYLHATTQKAPSNLKLVAVGGASVGVGLIAAARAWGIPAYEGYGLSEGASVQTLNLPGADLPGSAGRALPHARLRINDEGEIEVAGSLFAGYLGSHSPVPQWWPSGDLGTIDEQGFLHVHGRRKNVLITSFGRNVSPEWVEGTLQEAGVAVAVVFGDGEPTLSAVLWPARADQSDAVLQAIVNAANAQLPDYAQVHRWVRAAHPFHISSGMATANGRPQRTAILQAYAAALMTQASDSIYSTQETS